VPAPFSTTTASYFSAIAFAAPWRSFWISAVVTPSRRAASPGCGVRIASRWQRDRFARGEQVQRIGIEHERLARSERCAEQHAPPHALVPKPGPGGDDIRAFELHRKVFAAFDRAHHRFGPAREQRTDVFLARRDIARALHRHAARLLRTDMIAPPLPWSPPRHNTRPESPLCASRARGRSAPFRDSGSNKAEWGSMPSNMCGGIDSSASFRPSAHRHRRSRVQAGLGHDEFQRARRATATPGIPPVSASMPLGTSIDKRGAACA
jgi:hypothetical protein